MVWVILKHKNRFLLTQRSEGTWCFPESEINPKNKNIIGIGWFTLSEIHALGQSLASVLAKNLMYVSYLLQQC